jgi:hypothetical protein
MVIATCTNILQAFLAPGAPVFVPRAGRPAVRDVALPWRGPNTVIVLVCVNSERRRLRGLFAGLSVKGRRSAGTKPQNVGIGVICNQEANSTQHRRNGEGKVDAQVLDGDAVNALPAASQLLRIMKWSASGNGHEQGVSV